MTKGKDQEFVKAARLLWGGRWMVPLAQAAGLDLASVQDAVDDAHPVPPDLASVLVAALDAQADRIARRRADLVEVYAARGSRL